MSILPDTQNYLIRKPPEVRAQNTMKDNNWGVTGHDKQINLLKKAILTNNLFQTYLFIGPESIGKRLIAIRFIQSALSENKAELDTYHPSYMKIEHGNSDQLIMLESEKITIKKVRELKGQLQNRVYSKLFCVFDSYENILPQARQALLKLLEEPIDNVHFIILARSQKTVMETIQSRSQIIRFSSVQNEEGLENDIISHLARPGISKDKEKITLFNDQQELLTRLTASDLIDKFQMVEKIAKDENVDELLKIWISILRYDLYARIEGEQGLRVFEKYSEKQLSKLILAFSAARSLLKKNVNKKLVLENVCLSL